MERLAAHVAIVHFIVFVLFDVSLTVVLSYELRAAIVARVRPHALVRVHVRRVVVFSDERALAQFALERLLGSGRMSPLVQFQVPFRGELLVAYRARVRLLVRVGFKVGLEGGL